MRKKAQEKEKPAMTLADIDPQLLAQLQKQ
jgi:hypothetical protein